MDKTEVTVPEDGVWSEEDIKEFVREIEEEDYDVETGGDGGDKPQVHPGAVMTGLVLVGLISYSLYTGKIQYASLNTVLLVVLALGSKAIN